MIKMSITIGKVLGKFREQSGLSQIEVAKRMGLSDKSGRKYISRLENEQIKQPFLNTVLVYLDAIGVSRQIDPLVNRPAHSVRVGSQECEIFIPPMTTDVYRKLNMKNKNPKNNSSPNEVFIFLTCVFHF